MQCLFEKVNQFYISLLLSLNVIGLSNLYIICLSGHSKFDMDWNLFLQNCFYIKLLIIYYVY